LNEPFKENNKVPHYVIVLGVPIVKQPRVRAKMGPGPSRSAAVRLRLKKKNPAGAGSYASFYYAVGGLPLPLLPVSRAPTSLFFQWERIIVAAREKNRVWRGNNGT
jgi:hypothetical protein